MIFLAFTLTSGAVDVLEGRQRDPGNALDCPHFPLESHDAVEGRAVALPGGDAAQQNPLNGASVEVFESLRGHAEFLHPPQCRCAETISGPQ